MDIDKETARLKIKPKHKRRKMKWQTSTTIEPGE